MEQKGYSKTISDAYDGAQFSRKRQTAYKDNITPVAREFDELLNACKIPSTAVSLMCLKNDLKIGVDVIRGFRSGKSRMSIHRLTAVLDCLGLELTIRQKNEI